MRGRANASLSPGNLSAVAISAAALAVGSLLASVLSAPAQVWAADLGGASAMVSAQPTADGRLVEKAADGSLRLVGAGFRSSLGSGGSAPDFADLDADRLADRLERSLLGAPAADARAIVAGNGVVSTGGLARQARWLGLRVLRSTPAANSITVTGSPAGLRGLAAYGSVDLVRPDDVMRVPAGEAPSAQSLGGQRPFQAVTAVEAVAGLADWRGALDGAGIDVAVIDTGVDARHQDLAGRVLFAGDFVTGSTCPALPAGQSLDPVGHGTHVAGVIAGAGASGGLAPAARIVSLRALDCDGRGNTSDVDAALQWLLDHHADSELGIDVKVVTLSAGSRFQSDGQDSTSILVNRLVAAGLAVFVAAGEDGLQGPGTIGTPGGATYATTVGAVAGAAAGGVNLAFFSSRGPVPSGASKPDVTAPGVDIRSAAAAVNDLSPEASVTGTAVRSGTSVATSWAAGLAVLSLQRDPALSPTGSVCDCVDGVADVVNPVGALLVDTASDRGSSGWDPAFGFGLLEPGLVLGAGLASAYAPSQSAVGSFTAAGSSQRFQLRHGGGVLALSIDPQWDAAAFSSTAVREVSLLDAAGREVALDVGRIFLPSDSRLDSASSPLTASLQRTTGTSLAAGLYLLEVKLAGFDGNAAVDVSGATELSNVSNLLTLNPTSSSLAPGASGSAYLTLSAEATASVTLAVRTGSAALAVSESDLTLQPGQSAEVLLSADPGTTLSGAWLRADVTATADPRLVGYRTDRRMIAINAGLIGSASDVDRVSVPVGAVDSLGDPSSDFGPGQSVLPTRGGELVFFSSADALTEGARRGVPHIYVRDRAAGTLARLLPAADSAFGAFLFDATPDGSRVVISTRAVLSETDNDLSSDLYAVDWPSGATTLLSVASDGGSVDVDMGATHLAGAQDQLWAAAISADGTRVAFKSTMAFGPGDGTPATLGGTNEDVFVRDLGAATTARVSADAGVTEGVSGMYTTKFDPSGRYLVYSRLVRAADDAQDADLVIARESGELRLYLTLELVDLDSSAPPVRLDGAGSRVDFTTTAAFGEAGALHWSGTRAPLTSARDWAMFSFQPADAAITVTSMPKPLHYLPFAVDATVGELLVVADGSDWHGVGRLALDGSRLWLLPSERGGRVAALSNPKGFASGWVGGVAGVDELVVDENQSPDQLVVRAAAATGPSISSLSAASAPVGSELLVSGTALADVQSAAFVLNGVAVSAAISSRSAESLSVTVPALASGKLLLTAPAGWAASTQTFTATNLPLPTISRFSASYVVPGDQLVVSGANFVAVSGVTIGGVGADFSVESGSELTLTVPSGTTSRRLTVTTPAGTASVELGPKVCSLPRVTSLNPTAARPGEVVTVTGEGFDCLRTVSVAGVVAAATAASGTSLTFTTPAGFAGGQVLITSFVGSVVAGNLSLRAPTATTLTYTGATAAAIGTTLRVSFRLATAGGTQIPGAPVELSFNGVVKNVLTGLDGTAAATFSAPAAVGTYGVGGRFAGSAEYAPAEEGQSVSLTLPKPALTSTKLAYSGPTTARRSTKVQFKATLTKADGGPCSGREVGFILGGKTVKAKTNTKGIAIVKIVTAKKPGSYTLKIAFAGTVALKAVSKSVRLKVT